MCVCVCVCETLLSLFWISVAVVCMFPSDHIPIFRPLASSSRDGSGSWSEQKYGSQTRLVFVYMCVCFGWTHKMSSGTSVQHAYNSAIRLHALWSECLCECDYVWVSIWIYLLRCHDTTVENSSVDLKAQICAEPSIASCRYSHVLRREPQGGEAVLCYPLPSGRAGQGVGGLLKNPLSPFWCWVKL